MLKVGLGKHVAKFLHRATRNSALTMAGSLLAVVLVKKGDGMQPGAWDLLGTLLKSFINGNQEAQDLLLSL